MEGKRTRSESAVRRLGHSRLSREHEYAADHTGLEEIRDLDRDFPHTLRLDESIA